MTRRQTSVPRQWLVVDGRTGDQLWGAIRRLPRGSGLLFLYRDLSKRKRARLLAKLRLVAGKRGLVIADEAEGEAARVHSSREIRKAQLDGLPLLFLSPIYPTRSHPDWAPLERMKAAALLKLSRVPVIALGGMDERRFKAVEPLGFAGWAGIDAFRT